MGQGHIDQPAGIDDVIGRIQNASPLQLIGHLQIGQLGYIRTSGHRRAAQLRHAVPVQHPAETARRKNVAGGAEQGFAGNRVRPQLLHGQAHFAGVGIAHQQFGTRSMQLFGQGVAHFAQALHCHPQAFEPVFRKSPSPLRSVTKPPASRIMSVPAAMSQGQTEFPRAIRSQQHIGQVEGGSTWTAHAGGFGQVLQWC